MAEVSKTTNIRCEFLIIHTNFIDFLLLDGEEENKDNGSNILRFALEDLCKEAGVECLGVSDDQKRNAIPFTTNKDGSIDHLSKNPKNRDTIDTLIDRLTNSSLNGLGSIFFRVGDFKKANKILYGIKRLEHCIIDGAPDMTLLETVSKTSEGKSKSTIDILYASFDTSPYDEDEEELEEEELEEELEEERVKPPPGTTYRIKQ